MMIKRLIFIFTLSIFLFSQAQDSFYYFYSKFSQETVYKELSGKYKDLNFKPKTNDKGNIDYGKMVDGSVHLIPVGPLQMWALAMENKKFLVVYHVEPGGIAESKGIKKWDEIHGINKLEFTKTHNGSHMTGTEGPIKELGKALDIAQSKGRLRLIISRKGKKRSLPIQIEKLGRFGKSFPFKCRKTHNLGKEIANFIAEHSEGRRFSNGNGQSLVGLSLLMHGNPAHIESLENFVDRALPAKDRTEMGTDKMYMSDATHGSTWVNSFNLLFLIEYFWATGDTSVVPAIQSYTYSVGEQHQNPFGGTGHHKGGIGSYWDISFGAGGAINIAAMALAERAGFKVDKGAYQRYWKSMNKTVINDINGNSKYKFEVDPKRYYGAGYFTYAWSGNDPGMGEGAMNSAAAALGLEHAPPMENSRELSANIVNHLGLVPYSHGYIHTTSSLGIFFANLALSSFDLNGFKKSMEYRKYWLTLSRFPNGQRFYFHPKRARGGWGGDMYLGLECTTYYQNCLLLNAHKRKLMCQGNTQRNWLSKENPKKTLQYLRNYHSYYAAELVKKANKALKEKDYVQCYKITQKICDNYNKTGSIKAARGIMARLKKKLGRKLDFLLTRDEIARYVKFIDVDHEDHSQYCDEWRPKLLKYIAKKYKAHPDSKKVLALISETFGNRKKKSNSY